MSTITELATQMQRVADETAELAEGLDTEDYAETRKDYERSAELLQNGARCITDLLHDLDQIKCDHRTLQSKLRQCGNIARTYARERDTIQQDRDETFARLTTAYATCEKLSHERDSAVDARSLRDERDNERAAVDAFRKDRDYWRRSYECLIAERDAHYAKVVDARRILLDIVN